MADNEMNSMSAVRRFIEANHLTTAGGPIIITDAIVRYEYGGRSTTSVCQISIAVDTFNYGTINVESDRFDPYEVHTEFKPRFQTMDFDIRSEELVIKGCSSKMGGDYTVHIVKM